MFLPLMSVDHIISFLRKAPVRLRALAGAQEKKAEAISMEIASLIAKRDICDNETDRAHRIANRIEDLID